MLQLRPTCENCNKKLPNNSIEAMICSFECTFCEDCVSNILQNVCPNCGGGFEKRPTRPVECFTENCLENFPASNVEVYKPIELSKFKLILNKFKFTKPSNR